MSGFNVAELMATYRVIGASTAVRDLESVEKAFAASGSAAERSAAGLSANEKAMASVAATGARASAVTSKQRQLVLQATAAFARYNEALEKGNVPLSRMATLEASALRASTRLTEATNAQSAAMTASAKAIEESAAAYSAARSSMAGLIETAAQIGIVVGGYEALHKVIDIGKDAKDFQRQMLLIQTVANASTAEVTQMSQAVLNMAGDVGTAPDDLATSLYHVEQNGLRGAQALDVVATAAKGAKIGMADVEATTNSMTSAVASGIDGVQNMDQAMGALLATAGTGDMKMSDLNEALSNGILTVAKTYGLSLKDVGASLAVFGDLNMRGTEAASQLRQAIMAFAKPAVGPAAKTMLDKLGMTTSTLAKDMQQGGLNQAVTDLRNRLIAAGITGDEVGKALLDLFGKKAGIGISTLIDQYDRLQTKYHELNEGAESFAQKWADTQKTAGFALDKLGSEAEAAGIKIADKLLPVGTDLANLLAVALPEALDIGHDALAPFVAAWKALDDVLGPVARAAEDVSGSLGPLAPMMKGLGSSVLAMWLAWKGFTIAATAVRAIDEAIATMTLSARADLGSFASSWRLAQVAISGGASQSSITAKVMQADMLQVGAAAEREALAIAQAKAQETESYAGVVAASEDATAVMVASSQNAALAAQEEAVAVEASYLEVSAAAEAAAAEVAVASEASAVSWTAMLGPIGLVAVGLGALAAGFMHSSAAQQDAKASAEQYLSVLQQTKGAINDQVIASVTQKLATDGVYDSAQKYGISLTTVTQAALGNTAAQHALQAAVGGNFNAFTKVLAPVMAQSGALLLANRQYEETTSQTKANSAATKENAASQQAAATAIGWMVTAHGNLQQAEVQSGKSLSDGTAAMQAQTQASTLLKNALDLLNGVAENVESTSDSFNIALLQLRNGTALAKDGNDNLVRSLSRSTVAGNQNRQALVSLIDAAKENAQAVADSVAKKKDETAGLLAGNKALKTNEDRIRAAAKAAGLDKTAVDDLITSIGKISHIKVAPAVNTGPAQTALQKLQTLLDKIANGSYVAHVTASGSVNVAGAGPKGSTYSGHYASGTGAGGLPEGYSWVGDPGPGSELVHKRGTHVDVLNHAQSVQLAAMLGMDVPSFATGTEKISLGAGMRISPSGSTGLANQVLFGSDGEFGKELISDVNATVHGIFVTLVSAARSAATYAQSAASSVAKQIAAALKTDPGSEDALTAAIKAATNAQGVIGNPSKLAQVLGAPTSAATAAASSAQQRADIANQEYQALLKQADAAKKSAAALKDQADKQRDAARAMTSGKDAAEKQADKLEAEATAQQKVADAAAKMASKAKTAYGKLKDAADQATQAAIQDAQNLVSALSDQVSSMLQTIQGFESTVSSGLTAGSDLATIYGQLTDAVSSTEDALTSAQDAFQQAQVDTSGLAAAQQQLTQATADQTAAHQALTAALASGDQSAILAAQQAQTTAASKLAAAQAAVTAATPTADQLAAQAQAQQQLTDAQQAYNAAVQAASASGVASVLAQFQQSEAQFASDLTKLKSMGASQDLISQLVGLGDTAGDALAQGLIQDPQSLQAIASSMRQIQSIADSEGDTLAQGFYGAGVTAMVQLLAGIEAQFPATKSAVDQLLQQLAGVFGGSASTGSTGGSSSTSGKSSSGKSVTTASQIADYYIFYDTATKKYYDINPIKGTEHLLTAAQLAADRAAGAKETSGPKLPSFASGVTDFAGGLAYVHRDELLANLPKGTDVIPANRSKGVAPFAGQDITPLIQEVRALRAEVRALPQATGQEVGAAQLSVIDRYGKSQADRLDRVRRQR